MGLFDLFRSKANEEKTPQGSMAELYSDLTMGQKYSIMQLYSFCNVTCFENFKNVRFRMKSLWRQAIL